MYGDIDVGGVGGTVITGVVGYRVWTTGCAWAVVYVCACVCAEWVTTIVSVATTAGVGR